MMRVPAAFLLVSAILAPGLATPATGQANSTRSANDTDMMAVAKTLFGAERNASAQPPEPVGSYAKGCLAGAMQLPETGPTWQAMRLVRNRNWGHPDTIRFIKRLSAFASTQPGWNGLYVGDISQPRGGRC